MAGPSSMTRPRTPSIWDLRGMPGTSWKQRIARRWAVLNRPRRKPKRRLPPMLKRLENGAAASKMNWPSYGNLGTAKPRNQAEVRPRIGKVIWLALKCQKVEEDSDWRMEIWRSA